MWELVCTLATTGSRLRLAVDTNAVLDGVLEIEGGELQKADGGIALVVAAWGRGGVEE